MMDYSAALLAGKVSFVLLIVATVYYLSRSLLVYGSAHGMSAAGIKQLRSLVNYARLSHPYLAGIIPLVALYHIYVMWQTHELFLKSLLGIATAAMLAIMLLFGISLKLQPAKVIFRLAHRRGAILLVFLAVVHRLV